MIDIDDILSNFNLAFLKSRMKCLKKCQWMLRSRYGTFGKACPILSLDMEERVWERIRNTPNFYEFLPPYASPKELKRLGSLVAQGCHEFYFITSRFPTKGRSVQLQSQRWIQKKIGEPVSVIVSSRKGELCKVLGIDYAVDDAPHHVENLLDHGINTYIMDWPYNRHIDHRLRVKNLGEFLDSVLI
jgi:hypothetical protein